MGWKYLLVVSFLHFFFPKLVSWFIKKIPPRHPYLWASVNNILLPSTIRSWYTHVFKARKYTDSLFTEQHIGLVYFFFLMVESKFSFMTHLILNVKSTGRFFLAFLENFNCNYVNVRFWHSGSMYYTKIWCI